MAHIDDLVKQVSDPQLRAALMQQVSTLTSRKQFGLVFQEHSPESVRLPHQRVRTGDKVELRESKESATFQVISTKASLDIATVVKMDESGETVGEPQDMIKADLVVVKPFGDPVYPGLRQVDESGSAAEGQHTHVVICGENFHALQALEYTHTNKVDVIYIDPPYNTGASDWRYNDKYVDGTDAYRHSKWLSFMDRRLKMAKRLLKDSGVIFMSIDDNEQSRLRLLADSVFGEGNCIGQIAVVNNLKGRSDDQFFATAHESLIVYAKNPDKARINGFELDEAQDSEYKLSDSISRYKEVGLRKTGKTSKRADRPNMFYPIYFNAATGIIGLEPSSDSDVEIFPRDSAGEDGRWRWGKDTFLEKKSTELVIRRMAGGNWGVNVKMRDLVDGKKRTRRPKSIWIDPKYDTGKGTALLKDIFGNGDHFTNPKPIEFMKDIIFVSTQKDENAVVVDFFAGSGSTADAVIRLNAEDGGNRQCILVTNNELAKKDDVELRKAGFTPGDDAYEAKGVFHAVTMPRLKTVLSGLRPDGERYSDGIHGQAAAFFELTYEDENLVSLGNKFESIAPLLWMQAGATGELIAKRSDLAKGDDGYSVPLDGNYAVVFDTEAAADAISALHDGIKKVFIVTDSENDFKAVTANLPGNLKNTAQRLYSSYLRSFEINRG